MTTIWLVKRPAGERSRSESEMMAGLYGRFLLHIKERHGYRCLNPLPREMGRFIAKSHATG